MKSIPTKDLKRDDESHNLCDPNKEKSYAKMQYKTMPPLIVENGVVVDGNHRLRVAKKLKKKNIMIYEIKYVGK